MAVMFGSEVRQVSSLFSKRFCFVFDLPLPFLATLSSSLNKKIGRLSLQK